MAADQVELWGFYTDDVDSARAMVERALGIVMELHESDTIGPYYFAAFCAPHAELTLRPNLDPDVDEDEIEEPEDALAEPDFPDHGVLLYVDWHTDAHECRERFRALASDAQLLLVE